MNWMVKDKVLEDYLAACLEADLDNFKRDKRLTKIFEHATYQQGRDYLRLIQNQTPWLLKEAWSNDNTGNAEIMEYGEYRFSPSTLQYIGVLSNLIAMGVDLTGMRIVEIGGGYGGQCKTIMDYCNVECYHIIDLPQVCQLQRRYCDAQCFTEITGFNYDIVISNYALSEVPDNRHYIEGILKKSKHGYITCNTEFVQLDFKHKVSPDIPSEKKSNFILTW